LIIVLQILAKTVSVALSVVSYAMIGRMLIPLFKNPLDSKLYHFLFAVTEPFVIPVRKLFEKFNIGQNSPIDWSFTAAYLIIILIQGFLPII
jgi:uncharacterized protein YggT (Ycf19 family)